MRPMPNIAQVFKEEIARLARKQARSEVAALRKVSARYRSDIAALKLHLAQLSRQLTAVERQPPSQASARDAAPPETPAMRFSAKGFASHRKRLALSASQLGRMFGVSGQTIYLWEAGRARPRAKHLPAVAALRSLGRKQAEAVLASLGDG
jgi:DNA-binding transcriptional regulator YiaG